MSKHRRKLKINFIEHTCTLRNSVICGYRRSPNNSQTVSQVPSLKSNQHDMWIDLDTTRESGRDKVYKLSLMSILA